MKLTSNFSLGELTKSQTAERLGISNEPNTEQVVRLTNLCENILQKVRNVHGIVTVSSGFRCAELSEAVGSKSTSAHCANGPDLVAAADFECIGSIGNYDLAVWISENLEFDQLILECYTKDADLPQGQVGANGVNNSGWIHCAYKIKDNRKSVLTASRVNGKMQYEQGLIK